MTEDDNKTKNEENKTGDSKNVKEKDKRSRKDKVKPLSKIIIRRLPPSMTEETFIKQIEPIPDHDYIYYVSADRSLGQNAFCRAYINFVNQDDIFIFKDKFDGYVFIDTKGAEYSAVVEFAPFQNLPRNRARKMDNKKNTIESDQHYLNFLESLNNEDNDTGKGEAKLEFSYQFRDDKRITSTPLLEYLANKKHERREEKKKKIDDRKRQRDEERQRKKNFVSKSIPSAILEEDYKDDDIMVRTIRSRPILGRNLNKKDRLFESKPNNPSSEERYKTNRDERNKKRSERRRAERDKKFEVQLSRKDEQKVEVKEEIKPIVEVPLKEVKKEIKKYSEVRKERRARAEAGTSKSEDKNFENSEITKSQQDPEVLSSIEPSQNIKCEETEKIKSPEEKPKKERSERSQRKIRESDERAARRIRNKDRPSIEIYRPGKLRTQKKSDTASGEEGGKESPEIIETPKSEKNLTFEKPIKFEKGETKLSESDGDDKLLENEVFEIETKSLIMEIVNSIDLKSNDNLLDTEIFISNKNSEEINLEVEDSKSQDQEMEVI